MWPAQVLTALVVLLTGTAFEVPTPVLFLPVLALTASLLQPGKLRLRIIRAVWRSVAAVPVTYAVWFVIVPVGSVVHPLWEVVLVLGCAWLASRLWDTRWTLVQRASGLPWVMLGVGVAWLAMRLGLEVKFQGLECHDEFVAALVPFVVSLGVMLLLQGVAWLSRQTEHDLPRLDALAMGAVLGATSVGVYMPHIPFWCIP